MLHHYYPYRRKNASDATVRVVALCSNCERTTELTYKFELDAYSFLPDSDPETENYWKARFNDESGPPPAIVALPIRQYPSLARAAPEGISDATTAAAWNSAERAEADPPIKGMAYRQVLESAVKALEGTAAKPGTPLGRRVEALIAANALPNHLPELIDKARGLGNRAAHEFDDFDRDDVAIIRELCEAVLRQCFTIPSLVRRTEALIEKRKKDAAAKEAAKAAAPKEEDEIPF